MKKTTLIASGLFLLTAFLLFTAATLNGDGHLSTQNANGTAASTGAPGEVHTCSQSGCHGAGNGSSSSGGLADNAGPGSMSITSIPAMTGNQYTPGVTYSMIVTVSETGKAIFGFDAEILDNSGSTNLMVNNTAGTLTITNPAKTHLVQAFGTGRATVTHTTNAGLAANTATFGFNWKAPASGIVNIYGSSVAGNNDNLPNAQDNVYLFYKQVSPAVTGLNDIATTAPEIELVPNPAHGKLFVSFATQPGENLSIQLLSMEGKYVKSLANEKAEDALFKRDYSIDDVSAGLYLLQVRSEHTVFCKKLVVN
ncbi:MAG: choice-of-anchor V domain-containing protein [Bacteroidia bacterium]